MTDEDTFDLSRRKVLGALGTVGAAGALGGAGTSALLWDEEKFGNATNPNVLQAGQLDLKVDWFETYNGERQESWPEGLTHDEWAGGTREFGREELADQPDPVVALEDVKPGDSGEVTFSLHLFDNPGWLSMCGELFADDDNGNAEPELSAGDDPDDPEDDLDGELGDLVRARAWYDDNCNNELDVVEDGDESEQSETVIEQGSLAEVVERLSSCRLLDPTNYPNTHTSPDPTDGTGGSGGEEGGACVHLERLEWDENDERFESEDEREADKDGAPFDPSDPSADYDEDGLTVVPVQPEGYLGAEDGDGSTGRYAFYVEDSPGSGTFTKVTELVLEATQYNEEQPSEISFEVVAGGGVCQVDVKAGQGGTVEYAYEDPDCRESEGGLTGEPRERDDRLFGISHVDFYACEGTPPGGDCFANSTTYCVGFEWWLPRDIPGVNDNVVQTDRVEFQLGFEAVQCRHNVDGNGRPITLLPGADQEAEDEDRPPGSGRRRRRSR